MRVGLIIYGSLETISGGYLYDRMLVKYLQSKGDQIELISIPWRNYLSHLGDNLSPDLYHKMRNLQVDVLLQDELNHPSLFLINERVRKQVSYPFISIVHHLRSSEKHPAMLTWFYRLIERQYLGSLDGMVYNSQTTKWAVERVRDVKFPTEVAYPAANHLPLPISEKDIILRAKKEGPMQLTFLGNVIPRKGLHTLIDAMSLAEDDAFDLSIVGRLDADEHYARLMRERASTAGLKKRVKFYGKLDYRDLSRVLMESHVLVVPSTYEGFGIVYLEGMGCGLPAIASSAGGAKEIITHGEDGFLIEPDDADELLKELMTLHHDREKLIKMSLTALKRFKRHPDWQETGEKIRQYLQSVQRRGHASTT